MNDRVKQGGTAPSSVDAISSEGGGFAVSSDAMVGFAVGATLNSGTESGSDAGGVVGVVDGAAAAPSGSEMSANSAAAATVSSRRWKVAACVLAALLVILLALLGIRSCSQGDGFSYDSNAIQGQAPYKTAEELQAELNRIVDEGMFNISIASVIRFADAQSAGTAYIENVPGNRYDMQVTITLDSDGSEVYRSGVLAPDSYIGDITLSQSLAVGEYDATATFTALNSETHEEEGKAAAKISLVVG